MKQCTMSQMFKHIAGDPGTGKTTAARKMGMLLFRLNIIAKPDCRETTGPDIKGDAVGVTETKLREHLEAARGGILFIDEAYALHESGGGSYGKSAINLLTATLTKPDYMNAKTVVILAGACTNAFRSSLIPLQDTKNKWLP